MEVYEVVIYVCLEGVYVVVIVILSVSEQRERVIYAVFKGVVDLCVSYLEMRTSEIRNFGLWHVSFFAEDEGASFEQKG